MPGFGVMLHYLSGGSENDAEKYYGKTIRAAEVRDNELVIVFDDGVVICICDDGQSCCEDRYITCDDNPSDLVGGKLEKIEVSEVPEKEEEYGVHEMCFVDVFTDKAAISLTTHNEHNGYYGGFALSIKEPKGGGDPC